MGNPGKAIEPPNEHEAAQFWAKVAVGAPEQCWLWQGTRGDAGYGDLLRVHNGERRTFRAHRYAYAIVHGGVPAEAHVLHHCDTPLCCNPAHLWLGTHQENMQDMLVKGRHRGGHLPGKGHLSGNQVRSIRECYADGASIEELAELYKADSALIQEIVKKK